MGEDAGDREIDARGKPCPQPVVMTREAIRAGDADSIRVLVDSGVQGRNVARMANSQGWEAKIEKQADVVRVVLTRGDGEAVAACEAGPSPGRGVPTVVAFITSDLFGVGDEELGRILMRAFVKTIRELEPRPSRIIFANSGVRITTEGSDLVDDLRALENSGVEVISCGTCLDYYGLVEKLQVGRASNMFEIASALVGADRVVKL